MCPKDIYYGRPLMILIEDYWYEFFVGCSIYLRLIILLVSVPPCTVLGGGYNTISAACFKWVQPLIPFTHLLCANANEKWNVFWVFDYDWYYKFLIDFIVCPPLHYAGRWLQFNLCSFAFNFSNLHVPVKKEPFYLKSFWDPMKN